MLYIAVGATAVVGLTYGAYRYLYTTKNVKEDPVLQPKVVGNKVSRLEKLYNKATMSLSKNEVFNELYNLALITLGAVATSMVSKKLMKDDLGVISSPQRILRLAGAVGGGAILVKFLQKKDYVPAEPFKSC